MKINEKLKKASLEAEERALARLPDEENINWTPSEKFKRDMNKLLDSPKPVGLRRRIAVISAAALIVIASAVSVPFLRSEDPLPQQSEPPYVQNFYNNTVSDIEINAQPEYIPEGYIINSCTIWADGGLQIEYINGENKIVFQSYPADEVDLSAFEDIIDEVEINGNSGFAANNYNGLYNNNIAWNDGAFSYVITNSQGVELDELVKIALSVDTNNEKEAD